MNSGKVLEKEFKDSVPNDTYIFRVADNAQSFAQKDEDGNFQNNNLRFSAKNPYDFILFFKPNLYPMELKSTIGTSFSIQFDKKEKGKMIKLHQIKGLTKDNKFDGSYAGFVLNFRKVNHTYWLGIEDFNNFLKQTEKKSINEKDVIEFNGIIIEQKIRKVSYIYDVKKILIDIVEVCYDFKEERRIK